MLKFQRRRHMFGLNLVLLAGFFVSLHTLWISNKISEGGNVCASTTVFSCDDVIGNSAYNTDPIFGLSWGLIGILTFGLLMFLGNSVSKEPDARWAEQYLRFGKYITGMGIFVIALLISYEVEMGKICQFCSTAHLANLIALYGFWKSGKMHEIGAWKDDMPLGSTTK